MALRTLRTPTEAQSGPTCRVRTRRGPQHLFWVTSVERFVHVYAARPATSSISVARRRAYIREVMVRTLSSISSAVAVHAIL